MIIEFRISVAHTDNNNFWLDCRLLGAIGNALYESSGRSLHRPTYAYY